MKISMNQPGAELLTTADSYSPALQEYHEVILHVSGVQGQLRAQLSWRSMLEIGEEGADTKRQINLWQADTLVRESEVDSADLVPSQQTLSELIKICSAQLKEVASTGIEITAASRNLATGAQDIQEGVGSIKRKLARVLRKSLTWNWPVRQIRPGRTLWE